MGSFLAVTKFESVEGVQVQAAFFGILGDVLDAASREHAQNYDPILGTFPVGTTINLPVKFDAKEQAVIHDPNAAVQLGSVIQIQSTKTPGEQGFLRRTSKYQSRYEDLKGVVVQCFSNGTVAIQVLSNIRYSEPKGRLNAMVYSDATFTKRKRESKRSDIKVLGQLSDEQLGKNLVIEQLGNDSYKIPHTVDTPHGKESAQRIYSAAEVEAYLQRRSMKTTADRIGDTEKITYIRNTDKKKFVAELNYEFPRNYWEYKRYNDDIPTLPFRVGKDAKDALKNDRLTETQYQTIFSMGGICTDLGVIGFNRLKEMAKAEYEKIFDFKVIMVESR